MKPGEEDDVEVLAEERQGCGRSAVGEAKRIIVRQRPRMRDDGAKAATPTAMAGSNAKAHAEAQ